MAKLEEQRQVTWPLENLKRLGIVDRPRRSKRKALRLWIECLARCRVLLPLLQRPRLVRDRPVVDDAQTGRRILAARPRLEAELRPIQGLPDTGQVWLPVSRPR